MKTSRLSKLAFYSLIFIITAYRAEANDTSYVGAAVCKNCHQDQWQDWKNSDHDKAMQVPSEKSILGNFADTKITIGTMAARFFRKDGVFWVTTEGIDGQAQSFEIAHAFGHYPLQQYLIKAPNGRFQMLPFAWDSRTREEGGQKWFHIYGQENIHYNDRLHWTGPLQNWNGMCADCHSTNLKRNYTPETDSFQTSWSEINVACESCHGPGQKHVRQYQSGPALGEKDASFTALSNFLKSTEAQGGWALEEGKASPLWEGPPRPKKQIGLCASCHSRRSPLTDGFSPHEKYLDQFLPDLITPPNYHVDGQIKEEVYVFGSFLQSKMYKAGVVCTDCHTPHSMKVKVEGNGLCTQCHSSDMLDTPAHHQHPQGSEGAQCVNCHMPETTYMQVDPRRDHSLRIPRPDLTLKLGSPNACTTCHTDKSAQWAVEALKKWPNHTAPNAPHYGEIMQDVLDGTPTALVNLQRLLQDKAVPSIIRASGYTLLTSFLPQQVAQDITQGLSSPSPLIRVGAVRAAGILPEPQRNTLVGPLLSDALKAVRLEAAQILSASHASLQGGPWYAAYQTAVAELKSVQEGTSWRGEGRANLAHVLMAEGDMAGALKNYNAALKIDPYFSPSYVNLADILRADGHGPEGLKVLQAGLRENPTDSPLHYAMAMALIRSGDKEKALTHLQTSVKITPDNMQYAYVYAVALHELGHLDRALDALEKAHRLSAQDANILSMLISLHQANNQHGKALHYAEKLLRIYPNNRMLIRQISYLKRQAQ